MKIALIGDLLHKMAHRKLSISNIFMDVYEKLDENVEKLQNGDPSKFLQHVWNSAQKSKKFNEIRNEKSDQNSKICNLENGLKFKEKGGKHFQKSQLIEALNCYSKFLACVSVCENDKKNEYFYQECQRYIAGKQISSE